MFKTRRTLKVGLVALLFAGLAGTAIVRSNAHAGWGGPRSAIMKRFVNSAIDDVLDEAKVTPEQRTAIYASRDRVFTAFERSQRDRKSHAEEALLLFESDRIDNGKITALRTQHETEAKQIGDTVVQALTEVHDVLNPAQRKIVTQHIRSFRAMRNE